jgi:LPS-assembly lipoprotein
MRLYLKILPLCMAMLMAACGFTPVYQQGDVRNELQAINVVANDNREAQMLKAFLEDGIYAGGKINAKYNLIPNLQLTTMPLSIEANGTTQRYRVIGNATYQLIEVASGKVQSEGAFERFSSYSIAIADYSTYVAGKDSKRQVIEAVAEELRLRLISYFNQQNN